MTHPVDQLYFEWLVTQIEFPKTFEKTFHETLSCLHNREFTWTVLGDDNRVRDAIDLRKEFIRHAHPDFYENNFKRYASLLEVMIAMSRKLEFLAGGESWGWAWRLFENLRLNNFYDPLNSTKVRALEDILDTVIWRTYDRDGNGGFFPLENPELDQRTIELWYQMNLYVAEIQQ